MREILFRGKRKGCGAWVYGFLTMREFKTPAIFVPSEKEKLGYAEPFGTTYCVDPETVGQFTGLTDKNGKKIFEGDILKYQINIKTAIVGKIVFLCGAFVFESAELAKFDREWVSFADDEIVMSQNCCEVIGNIHDNPELLETA